ncbi:MAG: SprA-related family protein [Desulfobacter sp.]|nr:MAG: SprA-related family protein [Desulfobacter sp.]
MESDQDPFGQKNINSLNDQAEDSSAQSKAVATTQPELTQNELRLGEQLKQIDSDVRRHEMAHVTAGGAYITSGANFTYKQGPDGKKYAVGGEVSIDVSPVPGDPQATVKKMRQIRTAALAPADPSSQDIKVAANAASESIKAMSEITMEQAQSQAEQRETQAFSTPPQKAADAYSKVNTLPESDRSTFKLAI